MDIILQSKSSIGRITRDQLKELIKFDDIFRIYPKEIIRITSITEISEYINIILTIFDNIQHIILKCNQYYLSSIVTDISDNNNSHPAVNSGIINDSQRSVNAEVTVITEAQIERFEKNKKNKITHRKEVDEYLYIKMAKLKKELCVLLKELKTSTSDEHKIQLVNKIYEQINIIFNEYLNLILLYLPGLTFINMY
jgi:hypothetical protein